MKNPKRTLLIGFIVGLLFLGWWLRGFLYINWRFNLFSWDSWSFLFNEISNGWHITNKGDWIFFIVLVLALPLYFIFWYWANKIQWSKPIKKTGKSLKSTFKKAKKQDQSISQPNVEQKVPSKIKKAPPVSAQRPMAMPSFGPTMRTKPLNPTSDFQISPTGLDVPNSNDFAPSREMMPSTPTTTMPWSDSDFKQMADTPLSEVQLPQMQSVDEDIDALVAQAGLTILPDIPDNRTGWVAAAQGLLVWALYDDENGDWLADEEAFNDEDPLWFSETDHRVSPVFKLSKQAKQLSQKLQGTPFKIQPMLIERKGNLINAEDMLKTWNDMGIIVCRTGSGGPVQLKTVAEVFNQTYHPLSAEELQNLKQILS